MRQFLHHKVTIYKQTITQSASGGPASSQAIRAADVRCRVMPIALSKRTIQGRLDEVITHRILFEKGTVVEPFDRLFHTSENLWYRVMTSDAVTRNRVPHHVIVEAVKQ